MEPGSTSQRRAGRRVALRGPCPRSRFARRSRRTSSGGTSRSTPWRSRSRPAGGWSIPSTANAIFTIGGFGRSTTIRSRTTRRGLCGPSATPVAWASSWIPRPVARSRGRFARERSTACREPGSGPSSRRSSRSRSARTPCAASGGFDWTPRSSRLWRAPPGRPGGSRACRPSLAPVAASRGSVTFWRGWRSRHRETRGASPNGWPLEGADRERLAGWSGSLRRLRPGLARLRRSEVARRTGGLSEDEVAAAASLLAAGDRRVLLTRGGRDGIALRIRGADLLAAGLPAGPAIGRALARTLDARLDREISARQELAFAVRTARSGARRG